MVAPAYPLLAALVSPPIALTPRRPQHPAEGVAALEPQLDATVDIGLRRTVPPIGAPASPLAPSVCSPRFPGGFIPAPVPTRGVTDRSWAASPSPPADPRQAACDTAAGAVAAASAHDILNGSLDALSLGDSRFNAAPAPPALPVGHAVFQPPRHLSPYARPCTGGTPKRDARAGSPPAHHADGAHRSRSVLLRNLAPGIDDDSIRRLLESFGPLRELGAQHRARGGKGSVVAAFFDLRHARNAVTRLDQSFQFGRRIEARFQAPCPTQGAPNSPRQARGATSGGGGRKGGASSPEAVAHHRANGSPGHSPPKPVNQGTLVVFNLDPATTAEEIRELFGSIGDVKEIRGTPNKKHHKFVEFYDIRDAQRALDMLNKTELGGKKIKIEISRPGGRVNAGRNNGNSGNPGNSSLANGAAHPDAKFSLVTPGSSHMYAPVQTPPSLALNGTGGHTGGPQSAHQNKAGPHEGRTYQRNVPLSPFSSSYSGPFATNEMTQRRAAGHGPTTQNVNPGVGNTYPSHHGGPLFPAAALGGAGSPPGNYYGNMQNRHRTPPLRTVGLNDVCIPGPSGSLDSFQFEHSSVVSSRDIDPQAGRSFDFASEGELEMYHQRQQMGGTSPNAMFNGHQPGNAWQSMPAQMRRNVDPRCHQDVNGVPGNTNMFRGGPRSAGPQYPNADMAQLLGRGPGSEQGYDFLSQSREDLGEFDSPAFSPLSSSRSHDLAAFAGMLGESRSMDLARHGPSASLDMYGMDIGKDRAMYRNGNGPGMGSSFPGIGGSSLASSLPLDRRFNGNDMTESQQPPFANGNPVGNRSNHHDNGARRSSPGANRPHGSGNSHGSSSLGGNPKFALNISRVMSGDDTRTALMIRNIPNKYNQRMLLLALDDNHRGHFDFIYLPIDFKNKCNVGYAFINFTRTEFIPSFYNKFHGHKWLRFNSEKVCEITYARIQGKSNLIGHFQNSSLMNEDPKCRPVVFGTDGKQEEFPVGSNVRTKRGPSVREAARMEGSPPFSPMKARGRNN